MDITVLARKLALTFASGESNDVLAAAVQALFPSAAYVSLCLCGSNRTAVATSNLAAKGFMTQSLMNTRHCPCLVSGRPELVPVGMSTVFVPLAGRLLAGRFVCIPIPTMPAAPLPRGAQISGLVEQPGGLIGCLILGLAPERPQDPDLIPNAAALVRALAAELPGGAMRAAADIVSCVLPVFLEDDAAAAAPADASQPQLGSTGGYTVRATAAPGAAAAAVGTSGSMAAPSAAAPAPSAMAGVNMTAADGAAGAPEGAAAAACRDDTGGGEYGGPDSTAATDYWVAATLGEPSAGAAADDHATPEEGGSASLDSDAGALMASLTLESKEPPPAAK